MDKLIPTKLDVPLDEAEAISAELTIDGNLIDVYATVWGVNLDLLEQEQLIVVITNVARASYSRGYGDGCDDEALRIIVAARGF